MTDVDVPDWVVEVAMLGEQKFYAEKRYTSFSDVGATDAADAMKAALRAALSAWVVPAGFTNSEEMRELLAGRGGWVSGIELDGDTHTLYKLRQEKPE